MATTATKKTVHFVFSAFPAWGHAKSFCVLATRLVEENENVVITLILAPNLLDKAETLINTELDFLNASDETRKRIRLLSTFKPDSPDLFSMLKPLVETYAKTYGTLVASKPITCAITGKVFEAVSTPDIVVLDMLATRAITGKKVPIVTWVTGHVSHSLRLFGPASHGGAFEDLWDRVEAEVARTGKTPQEIGDSVYHQTEGKISKIAGVPDMYDWEVFPQTLLLEVPLTEIIKTAQGGLKESDAVFATTAYGFEEESILAFKSWFASTSKEAYVIGPILSNATVKDSPGSTETKDFLDNAYAKYGKNSVLLISFGTIFWTAEQSYIEEVIEALIEKKFPFILSYASPWAKMSDALIEKIKATGLGLISKWVPQQYILSHPATGWFMTHGGHNSVIETLGSGIPVICWPFEADQPVAAAHMTENLKVAFELIEVRTGANGMKPLLRNGRQAKGTREAVGVEIREVIDACRSEKGDELRRNAQAIKAKFAEAWTENGVSRKEFRAFVEKFGLDIS
ncbi:UDP-glycosyltransferase 84A1 [Psilocybe cubensis]|uniref:UDP-glycosyltransferase 84A1 n=1 Tax=Psilocybe cubensis TaxID=181762 RepID=A0ACB8GMD9_PSICU|nr:UDP-glycosyltransferase 84A1 [Psilocybe cubensis]KAH9476195.1 UDP-glycosyltransferase 84A1 [Psilocybe cubensis]